MIKLKFLYQTLIVCLTLVVCSNSNASPDRSRAIAQRLGSPTIEKETVDPERLNAYLESQKKYAEKEKQELNCPVAVIHYGDQNIPECPVEIMETECRKLEEQEKINCLIKKANKGDSEAMFFLGAIYKYDLREADKAIEWFKKAKNERSFYEIGDNCESTAKYELERIESKLGVRHIGFFGGIDDSNLTREQKKELAFYEQKIQDCYPWYEKSAELGYKRAKDHLCHKDDKKYKKWCDPFNE